PRLRRNAKTAGDSSSQRSVSAHDAPARAAVNTLANASLVVPAPAPFIRSSMGGRPALRRAARPGSAMPVRRWTFQPPPGRGPTGEPGSPAVVLEGLFE